jgi:hypothetical protein
MVRWLTVRSVTLACGLLALAVGAGAYTWIRSPLRVSLEDALDPAKLPQIEYVLLSARPDVTRKLYAVHANDDVTRSAEILSAYPPDHGLPLLKPDSPPETDWGALINADVVVDVPAASQSFVFLTEKSTGGILENYVSRRILVPLTVERRNIWVLSQSHGDFLTPFSQGGRPLDAEERKWITAPSFSGRLHRFKDFQFEGGFTFAEVEGYVKANMPGYANLADAWIVAEKQPNVTRNSDGRWHFYVPVAGSDEKIWLQLRNEANTRQWDQRVGGTLPGLWLPPGSHKFVPDPAAPTKVALLQLDGKAFNYYRPDESETLLGRRWAAHWGRYTLWSGVALLGLAGLMFLYWRLYRRFYEAGLPVLLQEFQSHILLDPPWRGHVRVVFGLLFVLIALVMLAVGMSMRDAIRRNRLGDLSEGTAELIMHAASFGFILSVILVISFLARSGVAILRDDKRKPVLYLRSFSTDVWLWDSWRDLLVTVFTGMRDTAERSLSRAVRDIGPLVAIGKPGDHIPPLGAARLYVDHDRWQDVVKTLAAEAGLVILRIGRTEGFWWELGHLVVTADPCRVLIFLPPRDRRELYPEFRTKAADVMPHPLPADPGRTLFLGFRQDWEPYLVDPDGPSGQARFRRWVLHAYLAPAAGEALQKVMGSLGQTIRRLSLSARERVIAFGWVAFIFAVLTGRI